MNERGCICVPSCTDNGLQLELPKSKGRKKGVKRKVGEGVCSAHCRIVVVDLRTYGQACELRLVPAKADAIGLAGS